MCDYVTVYIFYYRALFFLNFISKIRPVKALYELGTALDRESLDNVH